MSETRSKIRLFEERQVRAIWDEEVEKWWLSVVDVVAELTGSDYQAARKYWKVLKGRLTAEGNQTVTSCYQLKMNEEGNQSVTNCHQLKCNHLTENTFFLGDLTCKMI